MIKNLLLISIIMALLIPIYGETEEISKKQGVYEYVIQQTDMDFESASDSLEKSLKESQFNLLAKIDMAAYKDCNYRTRVFAVYDSAYAKQLLNANHITAPFAVIDRINLFEDEAGLHASIVNPLNINRTILMEDEKYNNLSEEHRQALRLLITNAIKGEISEKQYGQFRKKGHIGKTMGVMAGGPFNEKIEDVIEIPNGNFIEVTKKLEKSLSDSVGDWGLRVAYRLDLAEDIVVFGSSSAAMESKSFSIVNAGSDKSRKKYKCAGIAHAGAYPIEIVAVKDGDIIKVRLVNMMYRMKMFFEDAGKMAFMKNMGMPGSLQDELKKQIKQLSSEKSK